MRHKLGLCLLVMGLFFFLACSSDVPSSTTENKEPASATPGPADVPEPRSKESYTIADPTGDWGYPSPYLRYARGPGYLRMSLIFDTLVWKDERGFIPALAEKWVYDETDNAYTFTLREKAVWHDGRPVTANDVAFTVDYLKIHPDPFVSLSGSRGIRSVEVIDHRRVKLFLQSKYASFLYEIAGTMVILPEHIWRTVEDPMGFDQPEAVVGSGPYRLIDYNRAQGTYLYQAFEGYYQGAPEVKRVVFVKTSPEMVSAALSRGEVHAATVQSEQAKSLEAKGFTLMRAPYAFCGKMMINHRKEPLRQKACRQALAYAIDREKLVAVTQRGHGVPGSPGLLPPDNPWYNPDICPYAYNPEKARTLLESIGYTLNQDGYFTKDGRIMEMELLTQPAYGFKDVGTFVKNSLEDLGIRIHLRSLEGKTLDAKVRAWEFDLSIYGHGGLYEPSILPKVTTDIGFNSPGYTANETLNLILEAQSHEMDPVKRLKIVKEAQALYAEDLPALTLYYPDWYFVHDGSVPLFYTKGGVASGIPSPINKMAFWGK